jgi:hypothetical protein
MYLNDVEDSLCVWVGMAGSRYVGGDVLCEREMCRAMLWRGV